MRVLPVSSSFYIVLLSLMLTACTNPNVSVDFFAKNILSAYTFEVKNAVNESDIEPTSSSVLFDVECSSTVLGVEVYDPHTQTYGAIKTVDGNAAVLCATEKTANFNIPLSFVNPEENPSSSGDKRYEIKLRLSVKNVTGEIATYEKSYQAYFKASDVATNPQAINIASGIIGGGTHSYPVSGTCTVPGAIVEISISLMGSPVQTTCAAGGTFNYNIPVSGSIVDGTASINVKSYKGTPYYAFGEATATVVVDRVAPTVTLATPATTTLNNTHLTNGNQFTVSGICESGLPVTFTITGPAAVNSVTCVSGNYSATLTLSALVGSVRIKPHQTDNVGNSTTGNLIDFTVDAEPPAAFAISGILSVDAIDITVDNILTGVAPVIRTTVAAGASEYDIFIKTSGGVTQCADFEIPQGSGSMNFSLASCISQLVQGSKYYISVTARDAQGNVAHATNNGYEFTVQYPIPQVASIARVGTGSSYSLLNLGSAIYFDVTYDREVTVTSAGSAPLKAGIKFNSVSGGKVAEFDSMVGGTNKTVRFKYVIGTGEYSTALNLLSDQIAGGIIKDRITSVEANRTLTSLAATGISIDTVAPLALLTASLGSVPAYYVNSPAISFTLPTDVSALTTWGVVKQAGAVVAGPTQITSGNSISFSVGTGVAYTIELYAQDLFGNQGPTTTLSYTSFKCPQGFTYIYDGGGEYNQSFCVGSTEAKSSGSTIVFEEAGLPMVYVTQTDAVNLCAGYNPSGFTANRTQLITNAQWNTVAKQLANVPSNWSGNAVSTGFIYNGNAGSSQLAAYDSGNPCFPVASGSCTASTPYRRYLNTVRGEKIYDFAGNAAEFIAGTDTTVYAAPNATVQASASAPLRAKYGTSLSCSSPTANPYCGFGSLNFYCSEQLSPYVGSCNGGSPGTVQLPVVLRGGSVTSVNTSGGALDNAGIFAAFRTMGTNELGAYVGFRCVYHP